MSVMSEMFVTNLCHLSTVDEVLCVASTHLRLCNTAANYVFACLQYKVLN
jgi:hypothetical protein